MNVFGVVFGGIVVAFAIVFGGVSMGSLIAKRTIQHQNHRTAIILHDEIAAVNFNSPAFYAGLKAGDIRTAKRAPRGDVVAWTAGGRGYAAIITSYRVKGFAKDIAAAASDVQLLPIGSFGDGFNAVAPVGNTLTAMHAAAGADHPGKAIAVLQRGLVASVIYLDPKGVALPTK